MTDSDFQTRLHELLGEISTLPADEKARLQALADQTRQRHDKLRQTMHGLQESLDYLRLSVKYLVFDLEATRRENQSLRRMLGQTGENPERA